SLVSAALADGDHDVGPLGPAALLAMIEEFGDVRVEADAGDVEERRGPGKPDIDGACRRRENALEGGDGLERHAERRCEAVSGPGRHEPERSVRADERGAYLVDGAVASPNHAP